jgi:hypothetical protein
MSHIILNTGACSNEIVDLSGKGMEAIRFKFNPSNLPDVDRIKSITCAFISELMRLQEANPEAGREYAVAITNAQTASMWAVLAATKGK